MYRHPLDAISLFFGLLFTTIGVAVVISDETPALFSIRWLWPAILLSGGIVLLASVIPTRRPSEAAPIGDAAQMENAVDFDEL